MDEQPSQSRQVPRGVAKSLQEELGSVDEGRRPQVEKIARSCSPKYLKMYFRTIRGEVSPRTAIKVHCFHCVCWEMAEAKRCTAKGCPLWAYRPGAKRGASDAQ